MAAVVGTLGVDDEKSAPFALTSMENGRARDPKSASTSSSAAVDQWPIGFHRDSRSLSNVRPTLTANKDPSTTAATIPNTMVHTGRLADATAVR